MIFNRRHLVQGGTALLGTWLLDPPRAFGAEPPGPVPDGYPALEPSAARAVVGASHGNFDAVRELVDARPELAKSSWDWGFGDWESALGAASHTGNREIARYLIDHGARPTLFSAAMLGDLEVVRAFVEASPGVQATPGPHGIPLLAHARVGGEPAAAVLAYLEGVGGADGGEASPDLPVAKEDLLGRYVFGEGPGGAFQVSIHERQGWLMIQRTPDGQARSLSHLGDLTFHPAGAPSVRIHFELTADGSAALELRHADLHLRAARTG